MDFQNSSSKCGKWEVSDAILAYGLNIKNISWTFCLFWCIHHFFSAKVVSEIDVWGCYELAKSAILAYERPCRNMRPVAVQTQKRVFCNFWQNQQRYFRYFLNKSFEINVQAFSIISVQGYMLSIVLEWVCTVVCHSSASANCRLTAPSRDTR